ncbi:MAG: hypothetical protein IAE78_10700, partial [Myxococcus sp.]|nr:hypothetical protein [Myxococcus sp.]
LVKGLPQLLALEAGAGGARRVRVVPTEDTLPGATYQVAAATSGPNGLSGLLDLVRSLEGQPASQRQLVKLATEALSGSPELARLQGAATTP